LISASVVHNEDFERAAHRIQRLREFPKQCGDVLFLIERRYDDAEIGFAPGGR
jgi:hypothetical protein